MSRVGLVPYLTGLLLNREDLYLNESKIWSSQMHMLPTKFLNSLIRKDYTERERSHVSFSNMSFFWFSK